MSKEWVEIIKADVDTIDSEIKSWAEIDHLWDNNYELLSKYSLLNDIIPLCGSADVNQEEYDYDFPGQSGILYSIETNDPDSFKAELRQHIIDIISPPNTVKQPTDNAHNFSIDEIVDILMSEAASVRNMRAPAGYQGMADQSAIELELAAKLLADNNPDLQNTVDILRNLSRKIRVSGTKATIDKIIKSLV